MRGGRKQGRKNGKSWKTCQVEADMWDVKSREINIERVNRDVLKNAQSLYFYFKISCVKFNKICLCALAFTLHSQ